MASRIAAEVEPRKNIVRLQLFNMIRAQNIIDVFNIVTLLNIIGRNVSIIIKTTNTLRAIVFKNIIVRVVVVKIPL